MSGNSNIRNFLLSGVVKNPYDNKIQGVINGKNLSYPIPPNGKSWEIFKGLFGQRIIK